MDSQLSRVMVIVVVESQGSLEMQQWGIYSFLAEILSHTLVLVSGSARATVVAIWKNELSLLVGDLSNL